MKETVLQRQHGFTLLEVLVALLVVSIGLLGLAALMTTSLKNNQGASQRSQATWLAYDILDRMRANLTQATAGGYTITQGSSTPSCPANPNTSSAVASCDLSQWEGELAAALPAGDGSVSINSQGVATVTVYWNDTRGLGLLSNAFAGQSGQSLQLVSQL